MSLWMSDPFFLPGIIILITIVLWATSALPEYLTALLFFAAAMVAKIAPAEVIFSGFASSAFWLVFSGFVLGIAIRKNRSGRSGCAGAFRPADGLLDPHGSSVVLLSYALAFVMPSKYGAYCPADADCCGDGEKSVRRRRHSSLVRSGAGRGVWHFPALGHDFTR
ncbi:transporter, divalent anion:Na+ symporter (DASS) family [Cedecea neteri]|uniref:Transporter, divalent anion:Na+ symporter (DASS) family n=1 Tax=Cedecea neteri TaxID=158822 RepID=A0A2X2TCW7_9ENTR|nr:transporter, divalent anion:Na+ symporter (DASS) family [Cedecea neteri]